MTHPRAFALLELLFVVLILLVLVGGYSHFGGLSEESGTAETSINRASNVACQASRTALMPQINIWISTHPGEQVTAEALTAARINLRCTSSRSNGHFVVENNTLRCTDHDPPTAPPR